MVVFIVITVDCSQGPLIGTCMYLFDLQPQCQQQKLVKTPILGRLRKRNIYMSRSPHREVKTPILGGLRKINIF